MTLVVGAHPQNLSLSILARRTTAVAELRKQGLSFFVYGAGSQTIPLLKAGVIHLAGTGATLPFSPRPKGWRRPCSACPVRAPSAAGCLCAKHQTFIASRI